MRNSFDSIDTIFGLRKIWTVLAILNVFASLPVGASAVEGPNLGKTASPQEIAAWNMTVFPDGKGLPPGHGTAIDGKSVYDQRCAFCHGANGLGGSGGELAGAKHGLTDVSPDKTIGNYWPFSTTLFDYVRRAMPSNSPGSLSNDETYAVCSYLLYLSGIIPENAELNAETLHKIKMPNREGFLRIDAP